MGILFINSKGFLKMVLAWSWVSDSYEDLFGLIIHIVLNWNAHFSLCNVRTKVIECTNWKRNTWVQPFTSFLLVLVSLGCLWAEFERLKLLCWTWEDSDVVSFSTLSCPFLCDCIQIKGPVFDCKCSNVHLFKSVILRVMFVMIFSGKRSRCNFLLWVGGLIFHRFWQKLVLVSF